MKKNLTYRNLINNEYGYIDFAGYIKTGSGTQGKELRVLGKYAIVLLISGKGFYRDKNGFETSLRPGHLIFVTPTLGHKYGPSIGDSWEEIFFVFGGQLADMMAEQSDIKNANHIGFLKNKGFYTDHFKSLMNEFQKAGPNDCFYLLTKIQMIIAEAFNNSKYTSHPNLFKIEKARQYISQNGLQNIDLNQLAKSINFSYENFRKLFKSITGYSPKQYQTRIIMEHAGNSLIETNKTIAEISKDLNFCNEFHFSKQFKKTLGLSPKDYRKMVTSLQRKD